MIKAELKGSEKQIKWAEDIRDNFIKAINKSKENWDKKSEYEKMDLRRTLKRNYYNGTLKKAPKDKDIYDLFIEKAERIIKEQDEATFYINNRNVNGELDLIYTTKSIYPEGISGLKKHIKEIEDLKEEYKNVFKEEFSILDTEKLVDIINGKDIEIPIYFTDKGKEMLEEMQKNNKRSNFALSCIIENIIQGLHFIIKYHTNYSYEENVAWFLGQMRRTQEKHYYK